MGLVLTYQHVQKTMKSIHLSDSSNMFDSPYSEATLGTKIFIESIVQIIRSCEMPKHSLRVESL